MNFRKSIIFSSVATCVVERTGEVDKADGSASQVQPGESASGQEAPADEDYVDYDDEEKLEAEAKAGAEADNDDTEPSGEVKDDDTPPQGAFLFRAQFCNSWTCDYHRSSIHVSLRNITPLGNSVVLILYRKAQHRWAQLQA